MRRDAVGRVPRHTVRMSALDAKALAAVETEPTRERTCADCADNMVPFAISGGDAARVAAADYWWES